jgi:hypothetical protein
VRFPSPKRRELKYFETPIDEIVFIKSSPSGEFRRGLFD